MGTEMLSMGMVFLRLGYLMPLAGTFLQQSNEEVDQEGTFNFKGPSGEIGVQMGGFNRDYAFSPMDDHGTNRTLNLSAPLGAPRP